MEGDMARALCAFGENLKRLTARRGNASAEVADILRISEELLLDLEERVRIPHGLRLIDLMALCEILQVPPAALFTGLETSEAISRALLPRSSPFW